MNKIELKYLPYILKFSSPFITSKNSITERKGLIISLTSNSGNIGFGDSAPFPEYGSETYEKAISVIDNIDVNFKIDLSDIENSFEDFFSPINSLPSLRHGIEQAFMNLISKEKNITLNQILNIPSKKEINVNAVIGLIPPEETFVLINKFIKQGFKTIKLKAGRESFDDDFYIIKKIRENFGQEIKIRIDINGKWNLSEATNNLKKLESIHLEYVEQPVSKLEDLIQLSGKTNVPIAADESIRSVNGAADIISHKAANILILKPMMLGGIIPCLKIIKLAEENGINCIVSSSFESVIGRSFAAFIASLIKHDLAHGLDTGHFFEQDLAPDPYPVVNGKINFIK